MKTITVAAAKGGVGKTTLTAALAVSALLDDPGRKVAVTDTDPQGSLTEWWNARGSEAPLLFQAGRRPLRKVKSAAASAGAGLLFVDTPPGFSAVQEEAISAADLVLIPVTAGALDLSAVAATVEMSARLGRPYCLVLNRAVFRSRIAGRAIANLREGGSLLEAPVHQRVGIAEAMASGRTVLETEPGSRASQEIAALWFALSLHLHPRDRPAAGALIQGAAA